MSSFAFEEGENNFSGELGVDGVAEAAPGGDAVDVTDFFRVRGLGEECGALYSHASGYPINQQGKAGLGTPRFAVVAGDPSVVGPG
jgi:hypothetical protein